MTDTTPTGSDRRQAPPPTFFDPAFERLPAPVAAETARPGTVLLLYDAAADRAWVADAAIALATGWHAGGRRTVLADLSLDDPVLHERIGMANQDGIVDIFLYGSSLARSARPVPGRGFYLITAGTYTPDPGEILSHTRWDNVVSGFRAAQASLLLFVPAGHAALAALGRWAQDVIVLGGRDPAALVRSAGLDGLPVRAWLTPPGQGGREAPPVVPSSPAERFPEPEPAAAGAWTAPPPREPVAATDHLPTAEETVGAPAGALPVPDPQWETPPAKAKYGRKRRGGAAVPAGAAEGGVEKPARKVSPWLLALLAVVLLGAAAYALVTYRPDLLDRIRGGTATQGAPAGPRAEAAAPPAPAPRGPATQAGTAMPYAVFVKAYDAYAPARETAETVARRFPEARFYVTPEETGGQTYYKVLSGVLPDTAEASALRRQLVDSGVVDPQDVGTEGALIQPRPLAFDLGEAADGAAAQARVDSLAGRSIPAYAVPVPYSDGTERWKLYGGAFADSAGAEAMRRLLAAAGVEARLVERTGRPPASPK